MTNASPSSLQVGRSALGYNPMTGLAKIVTALGIRNGTQAKGDRQKWISHDVRLRIPAPWTVARFALYVCSIHRIWMLNLHTGVLTLKQSIWKNKIPIIKTIYRISREISASVFSNEKKNLFKGTVAVPFPHEKCRALGLLSGEPPHQVQEKQKDLQSVFIPTAPHPVSGFLVMYNQNEIQNTNIETEDLFKFLLSCGLYHPGEEKK